MAGPPDSVTRMNSSTSRQETPSNSERGIAAGIWIGFALFAIYGSWAPFDFTWESVAPVAEQWEELRSTWGTVRSRTDLMVNVLLGIPLGCFFLAIWGATTKWWQALERFAVMLLTVAAFAVVLEGGQLFLPGRTPSLMDIGAQILGASMGAIAWWLWGAVLQRLMWMGTQKTGGWSLIDFSLLAYLLTLVAYHGYPFRFAVSPVDVYRKFRDGVVVLVPFSGRDFSGVNWSEPLFHASLFVPVGLASARWLGKGARGPAFLKSLAAGLGFVLLLELGQIMVIHRVADVTDLITGGCGVMLGVALGLACRRRGHQTKP